MVAAKPSNIPGSQASGECAPCLSLGTPTPKVTATHLSAYTSLETLQMHFPAWFHKTNALNTLFLLLLSHSVGNF